MDLFNNVAGFIGLAPDFSDGSQGFLNEAKKAGKTNLLKFSFFFGKQNYIRLFGNSNSGVITFGYWDASEYGKSGEDLVWLDATKTKDFWNVGMQGVKFGKNFNIQDSRNLILNTGVVTALVPL
jgi:hypothetical protein